MLTKSAQDQREAIRYATEHGMTFDQAALALEKARAEVDLAECKNKPLKKVLKRYLRALDNAEAEAAERDRICTAMGGRTGGGGAGRTDSPARYSKHQLKEDAQEEESDEPYRYSTGRSWTH